MLAFITGTNTTPAMGFEDPIRVYFEHEAKMKYHNASTCIPGLTLASTCVPGLTLPACMTSYEVMERDFVEAVKAGSVCFGRL